MNKMFKFVLKDYFHSFKTTDIDDLTSPIYLLVMLSILMDAENTIRIIRCLLFLPLLLTMVTASIFPSVLSKQMYLCPMNKEMRKDYFTKARLIRTLIPIILSALILAVLVLLGIIYWGIAIGILLNHLIFALLFGSGINPIGYGSMNKNGSHTLDTGTKLGVTESFAAISCLFIELVYNMAYGYPREESDIFIFMFIMIACSLLISLPLTLKYLKNWPEALEHALSYETCYDRLAIAQKGPQKNG